jgi:hypothetical protein
MIPEQRLSTTPVPSIFVGGRGLTGNLLLDYETGGTGIQDPSQGLDVQVWRGQITSDFITLDVPSNLSVPAFPLYSASGITEFSFTFDQNMNPLLVFVQNGRSKMYWFDTSIGQYAVTDYGEAVTSPRVAMDDKRRNLASLSDIIFAYIKNSALCYRMQRERFETERILMSGVSGLVKIGINEQNRLQFETLP